MSIEQWDSLDEKVLVRYVADKLEQYEALGDQKPDVGYFWKRKDIVYGNDGMEVAYRESEAHLNPSELMAIIANAKWHLVRELKDVGVNLYKGYPPLQPY